jgi:hypothetical protein
MFTQANHGVLTPFAVLGIAEAEGCVAGGWPVAGAGGAAGAVGSLMPVGIVGTSWPGASVGGVPGAGVGCTAWVGNSPSSGGDAA